MPGIPTAVFVIARLTFREAARRWVLWVALLLGVFFLAVYGLGYHEIEKDIQRQAMFSSPLLVNEMHNMLLMVGLYVVNFLALIMTVLTSVDTISGEIASGTIHTLVSKPVRRWEILMGKWLGFTVMLSLYLLLMGGGVIAVGYLFGDYLPPNALRGMGLIWLNVLLLLSVSLMGGTLLSTLANGVLAFGLYGVAFIGGWIEQFGAFMNNQVAVNIGILCSLVIPTEALWRRAAFEMKTPFSSVINFSPFVSISIPSPFMILYALLYILAVGGLAIRNFNRRDL